MVGSEAFCCRSVLGARVLLALASAPGLSARQRAARWALIGFELRWLPALGPTQVLSLLLACRACRSEPSELDASDADAMEAFTETRPTAHGPRRQVELPLEEVQLFWLAERLGHLRSSAQRRFAVRIFAEGQEKTLSVSLAEAVERLAAPSSPAASLACGA